MKTKGYLIVAIITLLSLAARAQEPVGPNGFAELSGGVSLPIGQYHLKNPTLPHGFARAGGDYRFSYGIAPAHFPIGIMVMGGYYYNRYDLNGFVKDLPTNGEPMSFGTNENVNKLYYHGFYGLGGLYANINLHIIGFDVRALAGALGVSTPEMDYFSMTRGSSYTVDHEVEGAKGSGFCYDLGATMRIKAHSHVTFFVNLDYLYADAPYTTVTLTTPSPNTTSANARDFVPTGPINSNPNPNIVYTNAEGYNDGNYITYGGGFITTGSLGNLSRSSTTSNLIISYLLPSVGIGFSLR